eukprot:6346127-Amphidinium_carterae.1
MQNVKDGYFLTTSRFTAFTAGLGAFKAWKIGHCFGHALPRDPARASLPRVSKLSRNPRKPQMN